MGWSTIINADFGKYRIGLQNASISPTDKYSIVNNACQYYYNTHLVTQGAIVANPLSAPITLGDIPAQEWANLFGFKLYQDGVYTNKVAMLRGYCISLSQQAGNIYAGYTLRWAMFDETTHNYTWLADYGVDIYMEAPGSIQINSMKANIVFHTRTENITAHGGLQRIIYGGMYFFTDDTNYGSQYAYVGLTMQGIGEKWHLSQYDTLDLEGTNISPEFGPGSEEGGYGPQSPGGASGGAGGPGPTFDSVSDTWSDTPTKPGVLNYGLLNMYKCDNGSLNNLGNALFPEIPSFPSPPRPSQGASLDDIVQWCGDVGQWAVNCANAFFESVWNKGLIDYIVSLHLLPIDVTGSALEDIKVGPRTMTGILARPVSADVIEFDCGTIHVDEYYTNYVDYMTRCRVYIPFYGMVTIKPEYWQSADIRLKYVWNVMDGSFIAQLYSTITRHQKPCTVMIGQYSGCACVHMPLSGGNYASMFSQLAGAAGGMAIGFATGNVTVTANSAMALAGAAGNTGDMQQSNAYNASSAFYGHARAYLTIERPVSHFSIGYAAEQGLPLFVTKTIGQCSGLTICENPILNFACPGDEAKAIINALKEGVIL